MTETTMSLETHTCACAHVRPHTCACVRASTPPLCPCVRLHACTNTRTCAIACAHTPARMHTCAQVCLSSPEAHMKCLGANDVTVKNTTKALNTHIKGNVHRN